ncbi:MAG: hypothetical protein RR540_05520, partial [Oscillospiraceae bacterium]
MVKMEICRSVEGVSPPKAAESFAVSNGRGSLPPKAVRGFRRCDGEVYERVRSASAYGVEYFVLRYDLLFAATSGDLRGCYSC